MTIPIIAFSKSDLGKLKIYDVNTALNTYVPTEADYDFGKQMDSLKTLNPELYHLFVEPISEDE